MSQNLPLRSNVRMLTLDAVRGFALLGIMFVNMTWFTGFAVMPESGRDRLFTSSVDGSAEWLVQVLVDGKFWTVFAFLFGVGMAMQYRRSGSSGAFRKIAVRRMSMLLLIGLFHAVFVWFGDIVSLYAVTGIVFLCCVPQSSRIGVGWVVLLLVLPGMQAAVILIAHHLGLMGEAVAAGHGPETMLSAFQNGTYSNVFVANSAFLKQRWLIALTEGRFLKLWAMFLLGWIVLHRDLFQQSAPQERLLRRMAFMGIGVGLPLQIAIYSLFPHASMRPPSLDGFLAEILKTWGTPLLSLGYVAAFLLAVQRFPVSRLAQILAVYGRMSLTNYVAQSVIGFAIFYGCAGGLWGQIGMASSWVWIASIFAFQATISSFWLQRFEHGPLEWLVRCATYGRWFRFRKQDDAEVFRILKKARGER